MSSNSQNESVQQRRALSSVGLVMVIGGVLLAVFAVYLLVTEGSKYPPDPRWFVHEGNAARGRSAILRQGCGTCHVIPGIRNATGRVGPQLNDLRIQTYLAGVLPNTPENLVLWIRNPQHVNPLTAMPNLALTEQEARDIAAYLYERTRRNRDRLSTRQ